MYSIKVKFRDSDSFESWQACEEVGLNWQRLDKAQLAFDYFFQHLVAYKEAVNDDFRKSSKPSFSIESIKNQPWFYGGEPHAKGVDEHAWKEVLLVEKDDGDIFGINVFWLGFFQTFHSAEIVLSEVQDNNFWNQLKLYDPEYFGETRNSLK